MRKSEPTLKLRRRPSQPVTLNMPNEVVAALTAIAELKDMSVESLLRYYIGMEMRQDLSNLFSERLQTSLAGLLARPESSEEKAALISKERWVERREDPDGESLPVARSSLTG
jgi:hypothetical protein